MSTEPGSLRIVPVETVQPIHHKNIAALCSNCHKGPLLMVQCSATRLCAACLTCKHHREISLGKSIPPPADTESHDR